MQRPAKMVQQIIIFIVLANSLDIGNLGYRKAKDTHGFIFSWTKFVFVINDNCFEENRVASMKINSGFSSFG